MNSNQRVRAALNFQTPDYVPLFDVYWGGFINSWRKSQGLSQRRNIPLDDVVYDDEDILSYFRVDMHQANPNEEPWPSQVEVLDQQGDTIIQRDGWGRVLRRKTSSPFGMTLEVALKNKGDLDNLEFENPNNEARYQRMHSEIQLGQNMPHRPYIFLKIGGPFLRPSFLRGEFQWYMDIAEDPAFASALSEAVADHLIDVGTQALKRSALPETFLMIHDDIASNRGLLISPTAFGHLFLPQIQRMVTAFKKAGVVHVGYHSDGDIRDIVEGLIDVGISILNPIEPRANMDVFELKQRYGDKLAFIGGLCNSVILPTGSEDEVRQHVERVLFAGENGGLVIGSHSISNELTLDRYHLVMEILHQHGRPLPGET